MEARPETEFRDCPTAGERVNDTAGRVPEHWPIVREPAYYILNLVASDGAQALPRNQATLLLRRGMCGIDARERHRGALAAGDLVLVYAGAPMREFIGRAELASAVHDWSASEAEVYPGDCSAGVLLAHVEEWDPPVPMSAVLSEIDSPTARADFAAGVVRISAREYEAALAVAARLSD